MSVATEVPTKTRLLKPRYYCDILKRPTKKKKTRQITTRGIANQDPVKSPEFVDSFAD